MATIRITVNAPDVETATAVKDEFYKKLYEHSGTRVIFEVPEGADEDVKTIETFAKEKGCEASHEAFEDPLDSAEGVDFW